MNKFAHKIRLKPLDRFFFGSEKNFSFRQRSNYFARSRRFPQQTTLLGFTRYELLLKNDLLNHPEAGGRIENAKAATDLIGPKSFNMDAPDSTQDFGAILELSPLFIEHRDGTLYAQAPRDYQDGKALNPQKVGGTAFTHARHSAYYFSNYDQKDEVRDCLISPAGKELTFEEVFVSGEKVGIKKSYTGNTENKAFFKQEYFTLKPEFSFVYFLNLKGDAALSNRQVTMGADRSAFAMEVVPGDFPIPEFPAPKGGDLHRIVLLSDTYVPPEIYAHSVLALTETQDFRFLKTEVKNTQRYFNLSNRKDSDARQRSQKFNLLKKGSVLYFDEEAKLKAAADMIDSFARLQQIGYNYFYSSLKN